uniref:Uncharacterized protein n=1 Tax=Romanomermis culicivorax TaxID=13658 RepID=A0A915JXE0_ROMCU
MFRIEFIRGINFVEHSFTLNLAFQFGAKRILIFEDNGSIASSSTTRDVVVFPVKNPIFLEYSTIFRLSLSAAAFIMSHFTSIFGNGSMNLTYRSGGQRFFFENLKFFAPVGAQFSFED